MYSVYVLDVTYVTGMIELWYFLSKKERKKERKGTTTTSTVNSIVGLYVAMNCDTINGIY